MDAKSVVLKAIDELFEKQNLNAVEQWWDPGYAEHSAAGRPGRGGLRELAASLPPGFQQERVRVLAEGDLVAAHCRYHGIGPAPVVAFDLWRVSGGKIAEHWDARQPDTSPTPSGHTMVDGPAEVTQPEKTAASKQLVEDFVKLIMMGGDRGQLPRFFQGDNFIQHNPLIADGVSGLGNAIQAGVWAAVVQACHRVVADGEFVFTQSEGVLLGAPTVFYDLFRVDGGVLAEHWDVVSDKPETAAPAKPETAAQDTS